MSPGPSIDPGVTATSTAPASVGVVELPELPAQSGAWTPTLEPAYFGVGISLPARLATTGSWRLLPSSRSADRSQIVTGLLLFFVIEVTAALGVWAIIGFIKFVAFGSVGVLHPYVQVAVAILGLSATGARVLIDLALNREYTPPDGAQ